MIIILMGVAGSGKTTVGQLLSRELGWPFYEGDEFQPPANIEKMRNGIALTDADRLPWLEALAQLIRDIDQRSRSAIVACSALKQSYREKLIGKSRQVRFVYLKGSYDLILKRIQARQEHYMKAGLLKSQFEILEEPEQAAVIDIAQPLMQIVTLIRRVLSV